LEFRRVLFRSWPARRSRRRSLVRSPRRSRTSSPRTSTSGSPPTVIEVEVTGVKLEQEILGTVFQNPVFLASGTCGYGQEVDGLLDIDTLGGLVTKAVTPEPREGNPPIRV